MLLCHLHLFLAKHLLCSPNRTDFHRSSFIDHILNYAAAACWCCFSCFTYVAHDRRIQSWSCMNISSASLHINLFITICIFLRSLLPSTIYMFSQCAKYKSTSPFILKQQFQKVLIPWLLSDSTSDTERSRCSNVDFLAQDTHYRNIFMTQRGWRGYSVYRWNDPNVVLQGLLACYISAFWILKSS